MLIPRWIPASVAALLFLASDVSASFTVTYDFNAATGVAANSNPLATGSTIAAGSGMNLQYGTFMPAYSTNVLRAQPLGSTPFNTLASALANNRYWEFTVTPGALATLNLSSLTFQSARGGAAAPRTWYLFSSVNGFTAPDLIASSDVSTVRPDLSNYSVSLTGPSYQGLTSPVTFRMYVTVQGSGQSVEFDNVVLSGSAIPSPGPSTAVLAGIGAAAVGLWRRRRNLATR